MTTARRYVPFLKVFLTGRASSPPYLIYFITNRCNARCGHCFNGAFAVNRPASQELRLGEIERTARQYGELMFLFLTGGEPFIREDISDIAALFHHYANVIKIQIPSNGFFCDRIPRRIEDILRQCPGTHVSVTLSVDGIGDEHDMVRGVPGLFSRVSETYRLLKELEVAKPLFNVNVEVTISNRNQERLLPLLSFLRDEWGVRNILCPLVRGHPRDPDAGMIDIERYVAFTRQLKKEIARGTTPGYGGFAFSGLATAKDTIAREIVARTVTDPREYYPCRAGDLAIVLLSNGDVLACEMRDEILGNVREADFRIQDIVHSARAAAVRHEIRTQRCFCTHECFLTMNLLFSFRGMARILLRAISLKAG